MYVHIDICGATDKRDTVKLIYKPTVECNSIDLTAIAAHVVIYSYI